MYKKLSDNENIKFTYKSSGYDFEEYLNDMFYESYFYYTRHEPEYYLRTEGINAEEQDINVRINKTILSIKNPIDVKFTTKYPLVLINEIGPSEDDSCDSHKYDKLILTRKQQR